LKKEQNLVSIYKKQEKTGGLLFLNVVFLNPATSTLFHSNIEY